MPEPRVRKSENDLFLTRAQSLRFVDLTDVTLAYEDANSKRQFSMTLFNFCAVCSDVDAEEHVDNSLVEIYLEAKVW